MATNAIRKALGARIRFLRVAQRLTQEELASGCGLHVTYLSTVEHGKRNPSLDALHAVSKALGVSLSVLFEGI